MLAFLAAPALILAAISLATPAEGVPPYAPGFAGAALAALADPYYFDATPTSPCISAWSIATCHS